jgi:hypothetical protein
MRNDIDDHPIGRVYDQQLVAQHRTLGLMADVTAGR